MSCSEQSAFHGQASDRAWFFSELLFQSVAAKKKGKKYSNDVVEKKSPGINISSKPEVLCKRFGKQKRC